MSQFEKFSRETKIQKLVETHEPLTLEQVFNYPIYISSSYNLVKYICLPIFAKNNGNKNCCKKSHYVRGLKSEEPIKEGAYITPFFPSMITFFGSSKNLSKYLLPPSLLNFGKVAKKQVEVFTLACV
jgi:hypothetical protein